MANGRLGRWSAGPFILFLYDALKKNGDRWGFLPLLSTLEVMKVKQLIRDYQIIIKIFLLGKIVSLKLQVL
jgi:hypothetical protein